MGKVVAFAEFFAQDFHDVFGVVIVFGKDQCLGNPFAIALMRSREDFGEQLIPEGFDDGADLVGGDDIAVELGWGRTRSLRPGLVPSASRGFRDRAFLPRSRRQAGGATASEMAWCGCGRRRS